jgi:hypothetical protein
MTDQAFEPWFFLKAALYPADGALIRNVSLKTRRSVSFIPFASIVENARMFAPTTLFALVKVCIVSSVPIAIRVESAWSDVITALWSDTAI